MKKISADIKTNIVIIVTFLSVVLWTGVILWITATHAVIDLGWHPITGELVIHIDELDSNSDALYYVRFQQEDTCIPNPLHKLKISSYNQFRIHHPLKVEIFKDEKIIYKDEIIQNKRGDLKIKKGGPWYCDFVSVTLIGCAIFGVGAIIHAKFVEDGKREKRKTLNDDKSDDKVEDLFCSLTGDNSKYYSNPFSIPNIDLGSPYMERLEEVVRINYVKGSRNKQIITGGGKSVLGAVVANNATRIGRKVFFMDGIKISPILENNEISDRFKVELSKVLMASEFIIIDEIERIPFNKSPYLVDLFVYIFASKDKTILLTTQELSNLIKLPEKMRDSLDESDKYIHVDLNNNCEKI